ncbi:Molybdopterin adenylyltransferase [hydrothermal vent metagenome]|uniref:Molybdopterin adenylyltransferase n=1 Tax=hydrothermal vent metagenome TaxID=652676 RepID=A0A3B1AGI0_9ZZZZ
MTDVKIGILTISDRASRGEYDDLGGPAMHQWLSDNISSNWTAVKRIISDDQNLIEKELTQLSDIENCCLIITTGGTGPTVRDITPEATVAVCDKLMPGFGELMRTESLKMVATAILSRQTAGIRNRTLIVNLPGKPSAIADCLNAIFPAIPTCLRLLEWPTIEIKQQTSKKVSFNL